MMNAKALPARPGTRDRDGEFGRFGGQENGSYQYSPRLGSPRVGANGSPNPNRRSTDGVRGRVVLEGYRNELMSGFAGEKRYNPMNVQRPQSSMLLNINDPIQVHLLVETALGDSKEYEILSQEEVDDLKKQCQSLSQRIEQTRQNLAVQSKYRDAAISMSKLYVSGDKKEGRRRSIIPHHKSDSVKEADIERMRSEERCEELALELWSLEKRIMEPQMRLLKHTAGILQMTHKGPKKIANSQVGQQPGIPGSPESMYTYHNARNSMEPPLDLDLFDHRHQYRDADELNAYDVFNGRNSLGPPPAAPPKAQGREQMLMITKTEQKLEDLNSRLREIIIKANPQRENDFDLPPSVGTNNQSNASESLQNHLNYMEMGIATIDQEQNRSFNSHEELSRKNEELMRNLASKDEDSNMWRVELERVQDESQRRQEESDAALEETIEDMNREIRGILQPFDANRPEVPELTGRGFQDQLLYFQESVQAIEIHLSQGASNSTNKAYQANAEQMEMTLMGLWDIIQSGYEEIRKRKQDRRMTRSANGLPEDEDDMSDDDDGDLNEQFSLQAFSAKVQWLYSQATKLKDQKKVLQRQIKQQRELNNKSDATKDAEMAQKVEELNRTQALLVRTEADADNVREQLSQVMEKLDEARQQENLRDQARSNSESASVLAVKQELEQRNQMIAGLQDELAELKDDHDIARAEIQGKLAESESRISSLAAELETVIAEKTNKDALLTQQDTALVEKEKEIEDMNMKVAELQTEVTIARAELDGAYGSRAQRAAEVAANPVIAREIDNLTRSNAALTSEIAALKASSQSAGQDSKDSEDKLRTLKKELAETIEEYEEMTKASIEWEKDRERLEEMIDKLRDEREKLEAELSDEKVRWLGMRSPGPDGQQSFSGAGATSTTVLKDEFKKMMRNTRTENAKALRAEQAERRRLEDELRTLKKSLGPGKSSLSQSLTSA